MASEKKRGNREVRKPKQEKPVAAAAAAAPFSKGVAATAGKGDRSGKRPA